MPKRRANGEGNIRKRKDGRWEGRYTAGYDPESGKRIIKNVLGKTQAEVKEKLKTAISESQRLDVSKAGNYTVASWVRTWYEVYAEPRIRPNTKAYYTNYIENHILPGIGSIPLDKLTTSTPLMRFTCLLTEMVMFSTSKSVHSRARSSPRRRPVVSSR